LWDVGYDTRRRWGNQAGGLKTQGRLCKAQKQGWHWVDMRKKGKRMSQASKKWWTSRRQYDIIKSDDL
ncbi:MAG: hypothetical protein RSC91_02310, partial [Clostridia bacterium]